MYIKEGDKVIINKYLVQYDCTTNGGTDCTDYNDYTSCNVCSKKILNANEDTICREMGYTANCPDWQGLCKP